jgi:transcriptional regulator with XRE-family HTH domain
MASLGQELKRERELRGISLREIADSTRINLRFLQAIEEDRMDALPGAFFIRAILRSYAKSIGIDENQVLNKYQEIYAFEEQLQYGESAKRPAPRPRQPVRLTLRRGWRIAALAAAVIGLGLILFYLVILAPANKPETTVVTAQPVPRVEAPKPSPPPEPLAEVVEFKGLILMMNFNDETWLHVYADGQSVWDGIKRPGETLEVRAERGVRLNIGNSGGLDLTINGRKARPLGPRGAVRQDVLITLDNYSEMLESPGGKTG